VRPHRSLLIWLIVIAVSAAALHFARDFMPRSRSRPPWITLPAGATISGHPRVVDGDSLEINGARIRLHGIDAPEGRQQCRDRADHPYACGREAARALAAAIAGRAVSCRAVEHDRYNRDVAICSVGGTDLAETMVRAGHALDYPQHSHGRYAAAEREARAARRGIWDGTFEEPQVWRRVHGDVFD
jgi:endonuclease YncB( thermonuclease family)